MLDGVRFGAGNGLATYAVSAKGDLFYASGGLSGAVERALVWVDRQGRVEPLDARPLLYTTPRLSPNGSRLGISIVAQTAQNLHVLDLDRGTLSRFTFEGYTIGPVWTPDEERIVFASQRQSEVWNLWWRAPPTGSCSDTRCSPSSENAREWLRVASRGLGSLS